MASLVRWDPFRDLLGMQRDLDRIFGDVGMIRPVATTTEGTLVPVMDVFTRGEDLVLRTELPGIKAEDVDISVTDGVLTVKAERENSSEVSEEDYLLRETSWGTVQRSMRLPEGAPVEKIHAEYTDGVLEITVPKAAPKETRTHKIAVESQTGPHGELSEHH